MNNVIQGLWSAALAMMLLTAPAHATTPVSSQPIYELTSSGLITLDAKDQKLRVAIVFAEQDDATVPTLVRFVDAKGNILKQQRGDLSAGMPLIAELNRRNIEKRAELLVRVEVIHKLPGDRERVYPILVTVQPISRSPAISGFVLDWNGGICGCRTCGQSSSPGSHADCDPPDSGDFEL